MNSQLNRLRQLLHPVVLAAFCFVAFSTTKAQSVAIATLTSGGMNSVAIGSNGTFTLTLGVTTNFVAGGYSVFYQSNNGSGLFQITAITYLEPTWVGGNPPLPALLNPSAGDFGAVGDQINNRAPGTFDLQRITIQALNAPVGTYTIFLDPRSVMTDRTGGGFADVNMGGPMGPVFTVNVVPEPATVGLFVLGGAATLVAASRKRRT